MEPFHHRALSIEELNANHCVVSVHKYGFFLCRAGTARILLGTQVYVVSRRCLCIYTPNTFFQIFERNADLQGLLVEDDVDAYYPIVSSIDIRKRLQIRQSPCVELSEAEADSLARLVNMMNAEAGDDNRSAALSEAIAAIRERCVRHLRYAVCLKVFEVYFSNRPVRVVPQTRNDTLFNRFLASVYENGHLQRTVRYYADEQHLSPYYFSSIVRERSGKSVLQWIENVTMTFARQYLECTDMSVKEIAERMNFPDQSTFGRYFRKREGCSPSDFRRRKQEYMYNDKE